MELCRNIERTDKATVLGVVINDRLTATDHVSYIGAYTCVYSTREECFGLGSQH